VPFEKKGFLIKKQLTDNQLDRILLKLPFSSPQARPKGESRLIFKVLSPPLEGLGGRKTRFMRKPYFEKGK